MKYPVVRKGLGVRSIPEFMERSGQDFQQRIALRRRKGREWENYTYGELLEVVKKTASFLKKKGVEKTTRVALLGENSPQWAIAWLGVVWRGGVVIPLDPKLTPYEWKQILEEAEARGIFFSPRWLKTILEFKEEIKGLEFIISFEPSPKFPDLPSLWKKEKGIPREKVGLEDLVTILYTSGTTGGAKGVMLTHHNLGSNIDSLYQCLEYGPGDRALSILPLHHIFETTAGFLAPLSAGVSITYARSLKPKELKEDLEATQPTLFLAVPLFLEKLLQGIQKRFKKLPLPLRGGIYTLLGLSSGLDLPLGGKFSPWMFHWVRKRTGMGRLKYLISGGAHLPRWVSRGLERLGFPLLQGYGLSETSPVLTLNPPGRAKNASVGLPIPRVEIKIVNPGKDGVGEIAVKGPNVMKGYYKNEALTRKVFTSEGWFLTGDLGWMDKEGYLYLKGRKKSVIVTRGGKNIYPEEVEEELIKSPFIEEILVLRGLHPRTGKEELQAIVYPNREKVKIYFKEKGKSSPSQEEIEELIRGEIQRYSLNLAPYKRPRRFTLREEEFPKTTTRKIKRYLFEKPPLEI